MQENDRTEISLAVKYNPSFGPVGYVICENLCLLYQDEEEVNRIFIRAPFVSFHGARAPRKHSARNKDKSR